ncbi:MAG: 4'-phosphopantetheinyl transferase superfamily protein [Clostridia bacterium]|nr:4'-phosphopantetheinyl transferase superfamily protein [Clostridia bacterium]
MIRKLDGGIYLYIAENGAKDTHRLEKAAEEFFSAASLPPQKILKMPSGKPYFSQGEYFLSPSHTEEIYAVAFAPFPIGLDVEREEREKKRVAAKYFDEEESHFPFSFVWTAKEAVTKLTGEGLSAVGRVRVFSEEEAFFDGETYTLITFSERGFRFTLARRKKKK